MLPIYTPAMENTDPPKRNRGRQPVGDENVRDIRLQVRVNRAEQSALEAGAAAAGKPLLTWLRELGLSSAKRQAARRAAQPSS